MVMPYHLHMPSYFLETFTEYPYFVKTRRRCVHPLGIFDHLQQQIKTHW